MVLLRKIVEIACYFDHQMNIYIEMGSFTKQAPPLRLILIYNDYICFNLLYLYVELSARGKFFSRNAPPLDVLQR